MALETASFINGLVTTNPTATDPKSEGDDHIRLLKSTIKATFPNVTGAVTPTQAELNRLVGVTSAIQAQIDATALRDLTLFQTVTPTNGVSAVSVTGIPQSKAIIIVLQTVVLSASASLTLSLSSDNGATYQGGVTVSGSGTNASGLVQVFSADQLRKVYASAVTTGTTSPFAGVIATTSAVVNAVRISAGASTFAGSGDVLVYTLR